MFRRYPLTWACIALTWVLCLMPTDSIEVKAPLGFDKLVHVAMYLGTCSVLWWEYLRSHARPDRLRLLFGAVLLPILMSGTIEVVQEYATETRSGDWWDFAANSVGVLLAVPVGFYVWPPVLRRFSRKQKN